MKESKLFLLAVLSGLWPVFSLPVRAQDIACIGNGRLAVYEDKANILQVFGPPYSAPSVMGMRLDKTITVVSKREAGTAIWQHQLYRNGKNIGKITDFTADSLPCFIRIIRCKEPIRFYIDRSAAARDFINTRVYPAAEVSSALLLNMPAGTFIYGHYPMMQESDHQLLVKGNAVLNSNEIDCDPGETDLMVCGGPSYPECIRNSMAVLQMPVAALLEGSRKYWQSFTRRRIDFEKRIPLNVPLREKLLQEIDDVSIIIKTQQGVEGGVVAGHAYHMAYIRDEYGVSRCLLKLGYYREAKAILEYYFKIWQQKGVLHNAQGIGADLFHVHENDQVEITGYLIIQAFDYYKKTKDATFLSRIMPMLEWAWKSQTKNLVKFMLPFNGDETYVAGGLLPRSALLDGSAEATLLFITGGEMYLKWIAQHHLWPAAPLAANRRLLRQVKDHFAENFLENGKLLTNNPERMAGETYPEFRHGVCEAIGTPGCEGFGWTQRTANNRYLCPHCFATKQLPPVTPRKYDIPSVSLIPFYIGAKSLKEEQIAALVKQLADVYRATGRFPSSPVMGDRIVGYDYGFFLYSLIRINDPLKNEIYRQMMQMADATGAWVEYYEKGKPVGTRYRPWESGINLEAALDFAEQYMK